jgi:hypothetical protein
MWLGRYATDGTYGTYTYEPAATPISIAADGESAYLLVGIGGNRFLRRYDPAGAAQWTIVETHAEDVAVDAAGNAYLCAGTEVVSYDRTGAQRWRRTLPVNTAHWIAVTGSRVALSGDRQITVYDTQGTFSWRQPTPYYTTDVAITSAGVVHFIQYDFAQYMTLSSTTATSPPPNVSGGIFTNFASHLLLDADEQPVVLYIDPAAAQVTVTGISSVPGMISRARFAFDPAGGLYIAGNNTNPAHLMVVHRP